MYRQFNPSFNAVAKSWHSKAPADKKDTVFFATLDFADGRDVFQKASLLLRLLSFDLTRCVAWIEFSSGS